MHKGRGSKTQRYPNFKSSQMHLFISSEGNLSLTEVDTFNDFSIVEANNIKLQGLASTELKAIAVPDEDNHYWLGIDAVIAMYAGDGPSLWLVMLDGMQESAEPYAYIDRANNRVKSHLANKQ